VARHKGIKHLIGEDLMAKSDVALCLFVVFGVTGDLVRRKLLPALYRLSRESSSATD
jgi:glucose-6-phosphate 1-dehydrogenase